MATRTLTWRAPFIIVVTLLMATVMLTMHRIAPPRPLVSLSLVVQALLPAAFSIRAFYLWRKYTGEGRNDEIEPMIRTTLILLPLCAYALALELLTLR